MTLPNKIRKLVVRSKHQNPMDILRSHPEQIWRKNEWERADMTTSCRDSDYIPKIKDAGKYTKINNDKFQIMHNGVKVLSGGYHGTWMQKIIEDLKGHHEPQEEKLFYEIVKRLKNNNPVIVELGSFWAYYSNWLLYEFPKGTAYCCEPDPTNMKVGQMNARANGVANRIKFIKSAAGDEDQKIIDLELDSQPGKYTKAKIRTVDSLVNEYKINKIDILHMDVQGVELGAISGALESIRSKKVRFIFVSTHHYLFSGDPTTHQKCRKLLESNGAHIIASHNVLQSFSGDGLIVASFDNKDKDFKVQISMNDTDNSLFRPYEEDLEELLEIGKINES
jgi:FkbM family methyltransferase